MRGGTWQMYVTGQQRLLRRPAGATSPHQGLWSFLAFSYAPPKMNTDEYFWDAGFLYFGLIPHRPEDEAGLFGIWGQFSSDLRDAQRSAHQPTQTHEAIIEANYMYNVTPSLTVQPDIQRRLPAEWHRHCQRHIGSRRASDDRALGKCALSIDLRFALDASALE